MIFNVIFKSVVIFLEFVFGLLPSLPAMPKEIVEIFNSFVSYISGSIGIIKWLLSPALFNATIVLAIALFNFDYLFRLTMWLVRKLPLGVK